MKFLKMIFPFLKNWKPKKERREEKIFNSLLLLQGRPVTLEQTTIGIRIIPQPLSHQEECYKMGRIRRPPENIILESMNMDPPFQRAVSLDQIRDVSELP